MLSPLVSWILSPSSSSSSSSEEENIDINNDESDHENFQNDHQMDNVDDEDKDRFLSPYDVDGTISDASPAVTLALPASTDDTNTVSTADDTTIETRSKPQRNYKYSGGLRQYQRLWTKQDEMELLKGYFDYIKQQGRTNTTLQSDVASFYNHIMHKFSADFNRNQLVEKLRRLKRKHKMALDKGKEVHVSFKIPHDQAIFDISHKIWGNDTYHDVLDVDESKPVSESLDLIDNVKMKNEHVDNCDETDKREHKRVRLTTDDVNTENDNNDDATSIQGFIEETMKSCFSPLLKELLDDAPEEPLGELPSSGEVRDEQWLKRKILELEVYSNRLELLQGQIKARLEELRSGLG
uniref:Probable transcription factor At5g28040 n=1 Tax=Cicer arietinum TaxID=3827 RepID=A0A1S2XXI9_CICAR|nr:probable transcription factor At5g28040 [Cicer arietinum]